MRNAIFSLVAVIVFFPLPAAAYLDPGTGSMIIHLIVGSFFGALMVFKVYWYKVKSFFQRSDSDTKTDKIDQ